MATASLPPERAVFPVLVSVNGLVISRVIEGGGTEIAVDLTCWPAEEVVRVQVAEVLAHLVGPLGAWRQKASIGKAMVGLRRLLEWLETESIVDLADFTAAHWESWTQSVESRFAPTTAFEVIAKSKKILGGSSGVKPAAKWAIKARQGHLTRPDTQPAYSRSEFQALERQSMHAVWKAHRRITRNHRLALMDTTLSPPEVQLRAGALRQLLDGAIPSSAREIKAAGLPQVEVTVGNRLVFHHLMFTAEEAMAAYVLLTCLEGFNSSTLERLSLGDESASIGDETATITVDLDKPRRRDGRFFASIWTGRTERAYTMIKEATEPARTILRNRGVPSDLVLLYSTHAALPTADGYVSHHIMAGIPKARSANKGGGARYSSSWLPDGVSINFQKLHRTFQTVINRTPTHNTRRTHLRAYLALSESARASLRAVAINGFQAALDRAEETVSLRLSADEDTSPEVLSGDLDTATVACKDIEHHPVTQTICTDNFLMCLMCPNAIATQRHLPRLVLIHEVLTDLRSAVSQRVWGRWAADYLRLTAFLEREVRLTEEQRLVSLRKVDNEDHKHVRALLNGTYDYE